MPLRYEVLHRGVYWGCLERPEEGGEARGHNCPLRHAHQNVCALGSARDGAELNVLKLWLLFVGETSGGSFSANRNVRAAKYFFVQYELIPV